MQVRDRLAQGWPPICVYRGVPGLELAVAAIGRLRVHPLAEPLLESSIAIAEGVGDAETVASASNNLGNLLATQGRLDEATLAYRRALDYATPAGKAELAARASANLARILVETGQYDEASKLLSRSLEPLPAIHHKSLQPDQHWTPLHANGLG